MMKFLKIAFLAVAVHGSAYAASFVETNNNLRLCKANGKFAASMFDSKLAGISRNASLESFGAPGVSEIIYRVYKADYSDRTEAYMDTYAHCMDEHDY